MNFSEKAEIKAKEAAEAAKIADIERQKQEEQRRQIQDALNSQSYNEFRKYAEQQYPDNPDQQSVLIRQLQEQHYYQYMQQAYQQQQTSNPESTQVDLTNLKISHDLEDEENLDNDEHDDDDEDDDEEVVVEEDEEHFDYDQDDDVAPASMWTKKELQEFKDSIRKEGGDSIIKVKQFNFWEQNGKIYQIFGMKIQNLFKNSLLIKNRLSIFCRSVTGKL